MPHWETRSNHIGRLLHHASTKQQTAGWERGREGERSKGTTPQNKHQQKTKKEKQERRNQNGKRGAKAPTTKPQAEINKKPETTTKGGNSTTDSRKGEDKETWERE
jgi:hypothetical protein